LASTVLWLFRKDPTAADVLFVLIRKNLFLLEMLI